MEQDPFKSFQDFIEFCNQSYNQSNNNQASNSQGQDYNSGGDVPGGFQAINPQFFLILGEIIGNVMAGQMPFNIQNVIGNWLQLIGQAIETYNAQQQYMQSGPGRYYDIRNININNPFTPSNESSTGQSMYDDSSQFINRGYNYESESASQTNISNDDIDKMKKHMKDLEDEIRKLKDELEEIRNIYR